ncbi:MAG: SPW repeat domain-containing protein [Candidatus Halalkalibacterium sp. M3_1C_030]|jgi:hypothetical protein
MKTKSWIIGIVGLWILASAFLNVSHEFILWSNLIAGALVSGFGFALVPEKPGLGWTAGILGLWLIVTAFIPGLHEGMGLLWNGIIAGIIVTYDGFYALSTSPKQKQAV